MAPLLQVPIHGFGEQKAVVFQISFDDHESALGFAEGLAQFFSENFIFDHASHKFHFVKPKADPRFEAKGKIEFV